MAGPSRPKPPSAIDGYRRLERTRSVAPQTGVVVATAAVAPRRRIRPARIAGIMRLAGFVAVLAIIVGTSVSLASADTRRGTQAAEPVATPAPVVHTVTAKAERTEKAEPDAISTSAEDVDVAPTAADDANAEVTATAEQPEAEATAVAGVADVPDAAPAATTRARALPFTGELEVQRILLAGSTLVLFGMLVQIAGQPLPANRAHARTR